jgi:hypothetical protein
MQVDAKGAILDVVDAMAELPDARRIPALNDLFGQESARTIAPLINNLDILRESFDLVANEGDYAGSMTAEAQRRADTTENTLQLTRNTIAAIATTVGTELLPGFDRVLETVNEVLRGIYGWGEAIGSFKESLDAIEMPAWIGEGNGLRIGYEGSRLQRWMGGGDAPGRALGGPVRAGIAYEWQEQGRELFVPATDGRVMSNREVRTVERQVAASRSVTFNQSFTINAPAGMSAREIARAIDERFRRATEGNGLELHDGGLYAS